jgi:hypothetical protein
VVRRNPDQALFVDAGGKNSESFFVGEKVLHVPEKKNAARESGVQLDPAERRSLSSSP